jgi:hypothetical protein
MLPIGLNGVNRARAGYFGEIKVCHPVPNSKAIQTKIFNNKGGVVLIVFDVSLKAAQKFFAYERLFNEALSGIALAVVKDRFCLAGIVELLGAAAAFNEWAIWKKNAVTPHRFEMVCKIVFLAV